MYCFIVKGLLIAFHAVLALASPGEPLLRAPKISINDIRTWEAGERLGNLRAYHNYLQAYSQGIIAQFASILADPLTRRNYNFLKQICHSQETLLAFDELWALLEDGTLQYSNELMAVIFEVASLGKLVEYLKPFSRFFQKETLHLPESSGEETNSYLVASIELLKDASGISTWNQLLIHLLSMKDELEKRADRIWEIVYFAARRLDYFAVALSNSLDNLVVAASSVSRLAISSLQSSAMILQGTSPLESRLILMELVNRPLASAFVWMSRIVKILPQSYAKRFAFEVKDPAAVTTRVITLNGSKILAIYKTLALIMANSQSLDPRLPFEADPDGFALQVRDATVQVKNAIVLYHDMQSLAFPNDLLELVLSYKSYYTAGLFGTGFNVEIGHFVGLVIEQWDLKGRRSKNSAGRIHSCLARLKKAFLTEKPESQPQPARLAFEEALRELTLIGSWSLYRGLDFGSPLPTNSDDFAKIQRSNLSVLCRVFRLLGTLDRSLALLGNFSRRYRKKILGIRPMLDSFPAAKTKLARNLDVAARLAYPLTRDLVFLSIQTKNRHVDAVLKVFYGFSKRLDWGTILTLSNRVHKLSTLDAN